MWMSNTMTACYSFMENISLWPMLLHVKQTYHHSKGSDYEADFFNHYKMVCTSDMKDLEGMQEKIHKLRKSAETNTLWGVSSANLLCASCDLCRALS